MLAVHNAVYFTQRENINRYFKGKMYHSRHFSHENQKCTLKLAQFRPCRHFRDGYSHPLERCSKFTTYMYFSLNCERTRNQLCGLGPKRKPSKFKILHVYALELID